MAAAGLAILENNNTPNSRCQKEIHGAARLGDQTARADEGCPRAAELTWRAHNMDACQHLSSTRRLQCTDLIQAMIFHRSSSVLITSPKGGIGPTTFSEPLRL